MNQQKIGKFIAHCRKKQNLTQKVLAERLGVSDRAISKWETGKNMPDLSLFEPLCAELNISINDLLSGEKINQEEYQSKFEENIIKTISNVDKKNKIIKNILIIFLIVIIVCFINILLFSAKTIKLRYDENKMYLENNSEYGLRFIIENSCTTSSLDNLDFVKIDNDKTKITFISAKCSISKIIEYNNIKNEDYRMIALNFDIFDNEWENKYKFYYTSYPLNKIKTANDEELKIIIKNSYLLSEKNKL